MPLSWWDYVDKGLVFLLYMILYQRPDAIDNQSSKVFESTWNQSVLTGNGLTLKHWETHGCIVSTVATDALVLKHQAISIHNAD